MTDFKYGISLDTANSSSAENDNFGGPVLDFPQAPWALQLHVILDGSVTSEQYIFSRFDSDTKSRLSINPYYTNVTLENNAGLSGEQKRTLGYSPSGTIPGEYALIVTLTFDGDSYEQVAETPNGVDTRPLTGEGIGFVGITDNPGKLFSGANNTYKFAYMELRDGSGNLINRIDPSLVSDGAGDYVQRGSASAESGSDLRIYDVHADRSYEMTEATWFSTQGIADINGEAKPDIALDAKGNTATLQGITPTSVTYGTEDGVTVPVESFSVSGNTLTFDLGFVDSADMSFLGEVYLYVSDGVNEVRRAFNLTLPTTLSRQLLTLPLEVDERSFGFGESWTEKSGSYYYYDPAYLAWEQGDELSNVAEPVAPPPWSTVVWYHGKDGGMTQINTTSGDFEQDNNPPTVDAGAPRTATVGDTVQFGTNVTITEGDGTIDSLLWTQQAGPTVSINNAGVKNASATFSQAGSYEFPLTVTDSNGETGSDVLYITVNEAVTDSTLNLTVTGIGTGSRSVVLHDRTTREVVYDGSITFTNDEGSVTLADVAVGTSVYGAYFGTVPLDDGTGLYGVTE